MTLHVLGMKLKQEYYWSRVLEEHIRMGWVCCNSAKNPKGGVCWLMAVRRMSDDGGWSCFIVDMIYPQ